MCTQSYNDSLSSGPEGFSLTSQPLKMFSGSTFRPSNLGLLRRTFSGDVRAKKEKRKKRKKTKKKEDKEKKEETFVVVVVVVVVAP